MSRIVGALDPSAPTCSLSISATPLRLATTVAAPNSTRSSSSSTHSGRGVTMNDQDPSLRYDQSTITAANLHGAGAITWPSTAEPGPR